MKIGRYPTQIDDGQFFFSGDYFMESVDIFNILNILNIDTKGRTSGNIVVHCPTIGHDDSNPSCSISLDKGLYHCFSCGASGTLASLYKDLTGEYYNYLTELRPTYIRKVHTTANTEVLSFDSIPTTHFHAELKGGHYGKNHSNSLFCNGWRATG